MAASSRFKDTLPSYYSQSARRKSLDAPSTTPPPSLVNSAADQTAPFLAIGTNSPPPPTHAIVIKANPVTNQPALPKRPRRPTRPSLSDQLATIGLQADSLVKSLTKSNSNPPSSTSFTLPTLSMAVGRVDCKFPSPATFSKSECQFQFLLGTRDIAMHMYYHDMADVVFDKRALTYVT
ncbi:hypothetical protein DYB28_014835 [Aphanomyces astaci]|uniref:Uncharacterized protein n=1 Tax=Aphanomyces astaci TaxID=112090 RepID=A0A397DZZ1_APHAT|nr:hypothetical protein DYB25_008354 [Aphanomyces astaci]RHY71343.1 hypothetical protein DYB30_012051 [Aphanomyces astaci]RHZ07688.1 hypothetical protein DYB31_008282 [Aphanomyces astaci]RLO13681.1 hypothetical protein DYB28_014835 [Aphanomyces astaci]